MSFESLSRIRETHHSPLIIKRIWLGRKDSNLRMPIPKTGALPLGYAPALRSAGVLPASVLTEKLKIAERCCVFSTAYRFTRKDAPTSFEFDRLNGASLRVFAVKNPKHCRAAARE